MSAAFEITGLDQLRTALTALGARAIQAAKGALYREGEAMMTAAKRQTPVLTNALRASGTVLPPEVRGSEVIVTLGFGGGAVTYAVFVHEDLTKRHPVGNAKFLERAMDARRQGIDARLAADLRRELERSA